MCKMKNLNCILFLLLTTVIVSVNLRADGNKPPEHQGNWLPVLLPSEEIDINDKEIPTPAYDIMAKIVPSTRQLDYQNKQLGAFIHFGPATYINSDMHGTPDPKIFNPEKLDAEQWVLAAKSFGAKHVVLTAKHHNGFCLWPTKTTDYCVRSSPWKNGQGDVVSDLAKACRKHDMGLGIYISGGDEHFGCSSTPDPQGKRKIVGDREAYFEYFKKQLTELLSNYGEVSVVWFDAGV